MKRQSKRRKEPENPEPAAAMDAESDDDVVVAAESGEGSAVVAEPPVSAVAVAVRKGKKKDTSSGRLFEPFRAIGFVCNHVPASVVAKGTAHFLTTAVGDAYHVYNVSRGQASLYRDVMTLLSCSFP